jgi:hypothetical protein
VNDNERIEGSSARCVSHEEELEWPFGMGGGRRGLLRVVLDRRADTVPR